MPINLLYHGKMQDLYPDIDTENVYTWRDAFISRLSNDKKIETYYNGLVRKLAI